MIIEDTFILALQNPNTREQAFRTLMGEYKERLYWHIRKMVYSHDDADDVLQNTFIKVYRGIDKFKGDSKLYTWMYRIATNEAITFLNKKAKRMEATGAEVQKLAISRLEADVYFEGSEIQLKLQRAIASLPEKQQLVFNMKYFDDMKYDQMSEVLGTSVGALKSSYHIAVKKITLMLKTD